MLYGTFQPTFRASANDTFKALGDDYIKTISDNRESLTENFRGSCKEPLEELLGYRPIWCFPANTAQEAITHGMLTAPNTADLFFLIESDNAVRINKVKHYAAMAKEDDQTKAITESIDPECPDSESEFLLPVESLKTAKLMAITVSGADPMAKTSEIPICIKAENDHYKLIGIPHEGYKNVKKLLIQAQKILDEMEKRSVWAPGVNADELHVKAIQESIRMRFMFFILPVIYEVMSNGMQVTFKYIAPLLHNFNKLIECYNKMGEWSYSNCSAPEYDRIFQETWQHAETNSDIATYMIEHDLKIPEDNSPCPCESGKKFKKCHGRYMI